MLSVSRGGVYWLRLFRGPIAVRAFETWLRRYPFEVPVVIILEGAEGFPPGSLVGGTSPPVLVSPADSEVWTPSHSCGTLAQTVQTYLRSGLPWPQPRMPTAGAPAPTPKAASEPQAEALPFGRLSAGEVVAVAALREAFGDSMFPCKPVGSTLITSSTPVLQQKGSSPFTI
jgi:hypothetical protein